MQLGYAWMSREKSALLASSHQSSRVDVGQRIQHSILEQYSILRSWEGRAASRHYRIYHSSPCCALSCALDGGVFECTFSKVVRVLSAVEPTDHVLTVVAE